MKISLGPFKATVPKLSSLLLDQSYGQAAENCDLDSGKVGPISAPVLTTSLTIISAVVKSLYLWRVGDKAFQVRLTDSATVRMTTRFIWYNYEPA